MSDEQEEWMPLRQAVTEVADAYHKHLRGDYGAAIDTAREAIHRRLNNLFVESRAARWVVAFGPFGDRESTLSSDTPSKIAHEFWGIFSRAGREPSGQIITSDWIAGEYAFSFEATPDDESTFDAYGFALGIEVTRRGLPLIGDDWQNNGPPNLDNYPRRYSPDGRGIRKPLPQAMLEEWWRNLDDALRSHPEADLLDSCRACFQRHYVSRQRVRDLMGPRKRGPKPISGK